MVANRTFFALPMLIILLVVVPLLVLFIRLCIKKPKLAAAILAPVLIAFLIFYFMPARFIPTPALQTSQEFQQTGQYSNTQNAYRSGTGQSPIWSEGIEDQFQADVYPSGVAALRALAPRVVKQIPYVMGESGSPETIVIYRDFLDIDTVEQFKDAISKLTPEIKCRIEIGNAGINMKEVGIHFNLMFPKNILVQYEYQQVPYPYPSGMSLGGEGASGTIQARIYNGDRILDIRVNYINKSWVDDFSSFINRHPDKQYIIAKSSESCILPEEADRQVMSNAYNQVRSLMRNLPNPAKLSYKNILDSGIAVDKFVQSFDGSAGKIWRQAVLLDVSSPKLNHLAAIVSGAARARSMTWARTILSILGLFVLITIVYVFLNAATKGYYTWSLRVVGVILAAIFLFIILTLA